MIGVISQNAPLMKKNVTPYHPNFFIQLASWERFRNIAVLPVRIVVFPSLAKRSSRRYVAKPRSGFCSSDFHADNVLAACGLPMWFPLKKLGMSMGTRC